jgi:hypothetical protein
MNKEERGWWVGGKQGNDESIRNDYGASILENEENAAYILE